MAKMKWAKGDVDWQGLDDEEYDDSGDFEPYDGPEPNANALLNGQIKKIWLTQSKVGDWMFKLVFEASDNEGERKQFEGWSCWDNVLFSLPQCKFSWQPFLDALGITLKDIQARLIVGEEDKVGTIVDKIGKCEFPADVRIRVGVVQKGEYKGKREISKYLPPADLDDVDEDEDGDDVAF